MEFFFAAGEMATIEAARAVSEEIGDDADPSEEQVLTFKNGMKVLGDALAELHKAALELRSHAAGLRH